MPDSTLADLARFAATTQAGQTIQSAQTLGQMFAPTLAPRDVSIWEITTWILPMTPEHLRRVLAQNPDLPQGRVGTEGGTRWFTLPQVARLRQYFAGVASRHPGRAKAYGPVRPAGARAPLIALTGPQGGVGRSTALLHLAVAAALGGLRVLVLDADPSGQLAAQLGVTQIADGVGAATTLLPLLARSCGVYLRQLNAGRMDRGEAPLPMDEVIAAALDQDVSALIRPTIWPGLDIIAAAPALLLADSQIAAWRSVMRSWQPAKALATALDREGLRDRYDLILCDTPRGLGPLALSILTSADVLLVPWMTGDIAGHMAGQRQADGLATLSHALQVQEAEAMMTARALGQPVLPLGWRQIVVLPVGSATGLTGQTPNPLGPDPLSPVLLSPVLLSDAMPHVPQVADGQTAHFYALDYRIVGRLPYAPLRDACDAAWRGLAGVLAGLWATDATEPNRAS